uniref:U6 snRNA-associated Sm-like protein LSm1 n=3 Tax=Daphnia TaxID=6668 RepID=A0A0P5PPH6_9CRUS
MGQEISKMNVASLPGTATLLEDLDKKVIVVLRDGRTLIGYLRSVDQFANLVLHRTIERIHVGKEYGDIPRGVFIVRGENVALLGEIDLEKEERIPLTQVGVEDILEAQRLEQEEKQAKEKVRLKRLKELGLQSTVADYTHDDAF